MSKLDDRLRARQEAATANAQAASRPAADNGQRAQEPAQEPATAPAPPAAPPASRPARQGRQRAETPAPQPPQPDKAALKRWRWQLGATAGKLAAQRARLREAEDEWVDVVTDARDAGVPERVLLAAAADADVDLPDLE